MQYKVLSKINLKEKKKNKKNKKKKNRHVENFILKLDLRSKPPNEAHAQCCN